MDTAACSPNLAGHVFLSSDVYQHLSRFYIKSQLSSHLIRSGHLGPAFTEQREKMPL